MSHKFAQIQTKIAAAAKLNGRSADDVQLVAVSKKQSTARMLEYAQWALANSVALIFGENYVQEFAAKKI